MAATETQIPTMTLGVTEPAAEEIRKFMSSEEVCPRRRAPRARGSGRCSGFQYSLNIEEESKPTPRHRVERRPHVRGQVQRAVPERRPDRLRENVMGLGLHLQQPNATGGGLRLVLHGLRAGSPRGTNTARPAGRWLVESFPKDNPARPRHARGPRRHFLRSHQEPLRRCPRLRRRPRRGRGSWRRGGPQARARARRRQWTYCTAAAGRPSARPAASRCSERPRRECRRPSAAASRPRRGWRERAPLVPGARAGRLHVRVLNHSIARGSTRRAAGE